MNRFCNCPTGEGSPRPCRPDAGTPRHPWTEADEAAERLRIARHEASHAVVALALGRHVEYVTVIEDDPHAMHRGRSDGPRWLYDNLFTLMAGRIGEAELEPHDHGDCRARIAASREKCLGSCDECMTAFFLGMLWGDGQTDDALSQFWGHLRATVIELMRHPTVAEAIERVADALARRPLLLADDLAVIVNTMALRAVAAELLSHAEEPRSWRLP